MLLLKKIVAENDLNYALAKKSIAEKNVKDARIKMSKMFMAQKLVANKAIADAIASSGLAPAAGGGKFFAADGVPKTAGFLDNLGKHLNGKNVESEQNTEFISEALYKLKNYSRFPHLMKIRNGKLIDKSINNPFYNVLNLKKKQNGIIN